MEQRRWLQNGQTDIMHQYISFTLLLIVTNGTLMIQLLANFLMICYTAEYKV